MNKKGQKLSFLIGLFLLLLAFGGALIYLSFFMESDILRATIAISSVEKSTECHNAIFAVLGDEYFRGENSKINYIDCSPGGGTAVPYNESYCEKEDKTKVKGRLISQDNYAYYQLANIYPGEPVYRFEERVKKLDTFLTNKKIFTFGGADGAIELKPPIFRRRGLGSGFELNCEVPIYAILPEKFIIYKGIDRAKAYMSVYYAV